MEGRINIFTRGCVLADGQVLSSSSYEDAEALMGFWLTSPGCFPLSRFYQY